VPRVDEQVDVRPKVAHSMVSVGVLSPVTGGFFYGDVLLGIAREVAAVDGHLTVVQTLQSGHFGGAAHRPADVDVPVGLAHLDGTIAISPAASAERLRALRDTGHPVVVASQHEDGLDAASVVPDNATSVRVATLHLLDHGHTRIGFVGDLTRTDMQERHAGYVAALTERGVPVDPALLFTSVESVNPTVDRELGPVVAAVRSPEGLTALVVSTDRIALGLLRALSEQQIRVPEDLAVVGFDDREAGWYSNPPLTTVHQSMDETGALAARLLLAELGGAPVEHRKHVVPTWFVPRGSCGCSATARAGAGQDADEETGPDGAHGDGSPGDGDAPDAPGVDVPVPERLARLHARTVALLRDAAADTTGGAGPVLSEAAVAVVERGLTEHLRALFPTVPPPETVRLVAATLLHDLVGTALDGTTGTGTGPEAPTDPTTLRTALEQRAALAVALMSAMQATHGLRLAEVMSTALREQYFVAMGLVGGTDGDPRDLAWLSGVGVRLGCLALWDGTGRLRVTGTYDPAGVLAAPLPVVCRVEEFPPRELIEAADVARDEAAFVLPVTGPEGDHGFLALVATVNAELDLGLVTFGHWAAMLALALRQRDLLDEVRRSEQRYQLASLATNDGLWDWDVEAGTCFWSGRSQEMLGATPDPVDAGEGPRGGTSPDSTDGPDDPDLLEALGPWLRRVHPADLVALRDRLLGVLADPTPLEVEHRVLGASGEHRWTLCRAVPVRGPDGRAQRVVGSLADVHPRKELEQQLRHAALHDALTDLPNRRLFLTRIEDAVAEAARPGGEGFAVLFLDLDDFKAVNDSLGHPAGDELLQVVGRRLVHSLRPHDTAARFGGDEFAVLLPGIEGSAVRRVLARVRALVSEPVQIGPHSVQVHASVGVTTSAMRYASAEEVLRDADAAMYRAKSTGREATSGLPAEGPVH
jgi:diguanylate cyclase (GGDEF)-like protein